MASKTDLDSNVRPSNQQYLVRVMYMWYVMDSKDVANKKYLELILIDEKVCIKKLTKYFF